MKQLSIIILPILFGSLHAQIRLPAHYITNNTNADIAVVFEVPCNTITIARGTIKSLFTEIQQCIISLQPIKAIAVNGKPIQFKTPHYMVLKYLNESSVEISGPDTAGLYDIQLKK